MLIDIFIQGIVFINRLVNICAKYQIYKNKYLSKLKICFKNV